MKTFFVFMLMMGFNSTIVFSQKQADPCCSIIDFDKEKGIVTVRDKISGRISQFKPQALQAAELKVGDTVDASAATRKITFVNGIATVHEMIEPEYSVPCCSIVEMSSDPAEPCCQIVSAKNTATGESFQFRVPKNFASQLNDSSEVFTQPSHGYAMVSATALNSSEKNYYGFPILPKNDSRK